MRCRPLLVVGMPVIVATDRFTLVTPTARLQEKDRPGIPVFVPRLLIDLLLSPGFMAPGWPCFLAFECQVV